MENYQNSRPALYAFQTLQIVEKVKFITGSIGFVFWKPFLYFLKNCCYSLQLIFCVFIRVFNKKKKNLEPKCFPCSFFSRFFRKKKN